MGLVRRLVMLGAGLRLLRRLLILGEWVSCAGDRMVIFDESDE